MPVFQFTFQPPTAGCVSKVIVRTPWDRDGRDPQTGVTLSPPEAAWRYLIAVASQRDQAGNYALYFPPEVQTKCECIGNQNSQQCVLAVEKFEVTSDRQQVNAPHGQPVGNGRSYELPPEQPKPNAPRVVPQGMYDQLPDVALANTSDALLGDYDAEAGTYTDYSPTDKTEVVRQIAMPYGKKAHER